MKEIVYRFSGKEVKYFLNTSFSQINDLPGRENFVYITDENLYRYHAKKFEGCNTIVIPAGEENKNQETVNLIITQLIEMEATRKTFLVGVGGGVITDITGFVASVYMRGIRFGFVPTTILSQVDASIGGKNGIDVGMYKNLIGIIRQPDFILFDFTFLSSLPETQWINGFAEVIKHACINDKLLFELLEAHDLKDFQHQQELLSGLIEKNIIIKSNIVRDDEFEEGERKLLNFGHTLGHAIENIFMLPHGYAVSIGMAAASAISVEEGLLTKEKKDRIIRLLQKYRLPVSVSLDKEHDAVIQNLKMDKKRSRSEIDFILLSDIGKALIRPIAFNKINGIIQNHFQPVQIES